MLRKLPSILHNFNIWFQYNQKLVFMIGFFIILSIVFIAMIVVFADNVLRYLHDRKINKESVLLEILPKETVPVKETEKLIKGIHAMLVNTKIRAVLFGRPYMSFEIVGKHRLIKFYIRVPKNHKNSIVERIYATYSNIVIKEVEDYMPKKLEDKIKSYGSEISLGYHYILRIKTKMDTDIIPSLLAGLKDVGKNEMRVVQILVRPLDFKWQKKAREVLRQYELDGIKPGKKGEKKGGFSSVIESVQDEVASELNQELAANKIDLNLDLGSYAIGSKRKTRNERKEIMVASEKIMDAGFETVIRVGCIGPYQKENRYRVKAISAAFNELDQENKFKRDLILNQPLLLHKLKKRYMYATDKDNILTSSELANFLLRLPGQELIEDFPDVEALKVKEFAPPRGVDSKHNILAVNTYRGVATPIGIMDKDFVRHIIVQGMTGSGKSEWAKTLFLNNIKMGRGAMLLEPHGKLADEILEIIPPERRKDVIWFDLFDPNPPAFNFCKVFERDGQDYEDAIEKTNDDAIEIFKRTFSDVWSAKNESYISSAIKTIIDIQEGTMVDMPRLFTDKKFRNYAISKIKDEQLKKFWIDNFKENSKGELDSSTQSTITSVLYKFGKFLESKKLLRAVGQTECIDFKDILDNNKIVIFRLAKDKMGEDRINFIGGIAIKLLISAAFSRDPGKWKTPFPVFIDEAQNFISKSIKEIVYELRKYGIALILMHQALEQMNQISGLKEALYGSMGTTITFMTGQDDATYFAKQYGPRVDEKDLKDIPSRYGYCKLLVDGQKSQTFNIYTLDSPQIEKEEGIKSVEEIKGYNRNRRKHFSEIDDMLSARISDYNAYDEDGADTRVEFSKAINENDNFEVDPFEQARMRNKEDAYEYSETTRN